MSEIKKLYALFNESSGVSIDTRTMEKNAIFFAIRGERFDGNQYAGKAIAQGAHAVVVDDPQVAGKYKRAVLVPNALESLQDLANYHRNQMPAEIFSLTGSNGKTTTKELLYSVLRQKLNTQVTSGNLNNHIGVPLTLLTLKPSCEVAIIEMGANHQGEIRTLCQIAEPDTGLITNIGQAHLEGFGGLEGVRKGKGELFRFLEHKSATIFYNLDEPSLEGLIDMNYPHLYTYGLTTVHGQDYEIRVTADQPFINLEVIHEENRISITSTLFGKYNLLNISTAIAVGRYYGLTWKQIKTGIESYKPVNNRSQIIHKGSNTYLFDAYNANPTSIHLAIEAFKRIEKPSKALILGEMLELGEWSTEEHQRLVDSLAQYPWEAVFLIGDEFKPVAGGSTGIYYPDIDHFMNDFSHREWEETAFLIKGSRRVGLEKLMQHLV